MAASSSSDSESDAPGSGVAVAQQKGRPLPELPALARLAHTAPRPVAAAHAASSPALSRQDASSTPAASPALAVSEAAAAPTAACTDKAAGSSTGSLAAAEPELASLLRLHDHGDAPVSAGAALLSAAMSDVVSSPAAGRDADSEPGHDQQRMPHPGALASNIVAAPQAAARVQVCQGKSCTKRGAVDLLQQASAAASGRPSIEVPSLSPMFAWGRGVPVHLLWTKQAAPGSGHCTDMVVIFTMFWCRCLAASASANASRGLLCAYVLAGLDQCF